MATFRPARQRNHVALAKLPVAVVETNSRLTAENNEHLLAAVMEVIDELRPARLELPDRSAERTILRAGQTPRPDATPVRNIVPNVVRIRHLPAESSADLP